ncbi:hypothetical protein ACCC88_12345 [Sphingomonas sp. Sphisp140]|uniref:hypothetical protein n=1 Tax=unclassified Sphingomonas TaxID=196159 RepID=UPI0039B0F943
MLALLAGCDAPMPGNRAAERQQAPAIARTVVETEESARFRLAARELYAALDAPACGIDRPERLAPERAAVKAFEDRLGTTGAAFQLAVARADARFQPSCRSDGDIREKVAGHLAELWKLLPRLDQVPVQEPIPARSAEYRALVRKLVTAVQPQCPLSGTAADAGILAPALDAVRRFQASLPGTAYRHHYAIVRADVDLEQSMTLVECVAPSRVSPDRLRDDLLADVRRQIAALQAIRL